MPDVNQLLNSLGLAGTFTRREVLGLGPVSDSYLLTGPDGPLVLRKDRALAGALGLDRQAEWIHLNMAYAADLGPEPLAHDPHRGLLVTRYLEGTAWNRSAPADWAAHGAVMRRVHEVPAAQARDFDPVAVASAYRQGVSTAGADALLERVSSLASALVSDEASLFLSPRCASRQPGG